MYIINGLGGGGSSFVLRQLQIINYLGDEKIFRNRRRLEKTPWQIPYRNAFWRLAGRYKPLVHVMMRPDTFWTEPGFAPSNLKLSDINLPENVVAQRDYLLAKADRRSSGVRLRKRLLSTASIYDLVDSYLNILQSHERNTGQKVVLLSGHWGAFGIYKQIEADTAYLVRDPFNSVISHSKSIRHENQYLDRDLERLDSIAWVDCYLNGPLTFWKAHAEAASTHKGAKIIRYNRFSEDWPRQIEHLPDISDKFTYKENPVVGLLSHKVRRYIFSEVGQYFEPLGLKEVTEEF